MLVTREPGGANLNPTRTRMESWTALSLSEYFALHILFYLPCIAPGWNLPKSAEISQTQRNEYTRLQVNLFLVILLKFGFSSSHTNPYMAPHCLGFLCFLWENKTLGGFNTCDLQYVDIHIWRNVFFLNCLYGFSNKVEFLQMHWRHKTEIFFLPAISNTI